MKRYILALCLACLCVPSVGAAAEETQNKGYTTGHIDLEYRVGNISGSQAKANEYETRGQGPRVGSQLDWGRELYQFRFDGMFTGNMSNHNPEGFQKHDFDFSGSFRKTDHYRFDAYANRIGHNMSDGTTNKTYGASSTIYARGAEQSDFMYHRQRTNAGIGGEVSYASPLFASVRVDNQTIQGLLPLYNVNSGNVPYPVDYQVNTLTAQTGYRSDRFTLTFDGSVDSLENDKQEMNASLTGGVPSGNVRKPVQESKNYKVGSSLALRVPEAKSTFMMNASFANLTSDRIKSSRAAGNVADTMWDEYEGDIKNTNINAAFTTTPFKGFNARVYTKYFDRDNDSKVTQNSSYTYLPIDVLRDQLAFYEYDKFTVGTELSQRFAGTYKVTAGYEFETTDRNAYGMTQVKKTDDNKAWGQFNAGITDTVSARVRYQFLDRESSRTKDATNGLVPLGTSTNNKPTSWWVAEWFSYADSASKKQHQTKVGVDYTPLENLSLALDYVYTLDDYTQKQNLGMNEGTKHGVIADISYSIGPVKFGGYGGVEFGETKMDSRVYRRDNAWEANPNLPDNITAYNWSYKQKDTTYSLGLNSTIELIKDCLDLKLSYDFTENTGRTNLYAPDVANLTRGDIFPVDNYRQHNLSAKLNYTVNPKHSFGLGYYYSKLNYRDWAYSDVSDADQLNDGYYNVNQSYEAHAVGLSYRYKF